MMHLHFNSQFIICKKSRNFWVLWCNYHGNVVKRDGTLKKKKMIPLLMDPLYLLNRINASFLTFYHNMVDFLGITSSNNFWGEQGWSRSERRFLFWLWRRRRWRDGCYRWYVKRKQQQWWQQFPRDDIRKQCTASTTFNVIIVVFVNDLCFVDINSIIVVDHKDNLIGFGPSNWLVLLV